MKILAVFFLLIPTIGSAQNIPAHSILGNASGSAGLTTPLVTLPFTLNQAVGGATATHVVCSGDTTGATDVTTIQAAITAMPTVGGAIELAPCTYYINASLTIPLRYQFTILGSSAGTIVQQVTNNTPIWTLTGAGMAGFTLGRMELNWTNAQTSANPLAIGIYFNTGTSGDNIFNFHIPDISCFNGFRCISTSATNVDNVWGFVVDNFSQGGSMTGAFLWANNPPTGEPRIAIRDGYLGGGWSNSVALTEPEIVLTQVDQLLLENLEFNGGYYTPSVPQMWITSSNNVTVLNVKAESETIDTLGTTAALWIFASSNVEIINSEAESITLKSNNGGASVIQAFTSGNYNQMSIHGFACNGVLGSGVTGTTLVAINYGGGTLDVVDNLNVFPGGSNICTTVNGPTVASGFGTGASVPHTMGPQSFSVNVGTGASASSGIITLGTSLYGWHCDVHDVTTPAGNSTSLTASSTTTVTFTNYSRTTGLATAWPASDILQAGCWRN